MNYISTGIAKFPLTDFDAARHEGLSPDGTQLTIVPKGGGIGWFSDSKGPMLYHETQGNFVAETSLEIFRKDGRPGAPEAQYSSAGILIRDPNSRFGNERWIMYNIGYQNSFWGREIKVTRPARSIRIDMYRLMGLKSWSTLYLLPSQYVPEVHRLRLARVNGVFRAYFMNASGQWQREAPVSGMEVLGNGVHSSVEGFDKKEFSPRNFGLPDRVQAGIISNPGMNVRNPFVRFRDAYYRFHHFDVRGIENFSEIES